MAILTFPTIRGARTVEWYLQALTQQQDSPFDGSTQTIAMPGSRWRGTASYTLQLVDFRKLQAFLSALGGRSGRFLFTPPQAIRTLPALVSAVLVDGAAQTGASLAVKNLPVSTSVFSAGDWISWPDAAGRPQLHMVTSDIVSNGSGLAALPIAPPIRHSGPDGATVEVVSPQGVFMLTSDDQGKFMHSGDMPRRAQVSFEMVEALTGPGLAIPEEIDFTPDFA